LAVQLCKAVPPSTTQGAIPPTVVGDAGRSSVVAAPAAALSLAAAASALFGLLVVLTACWAGGLSTRPGKGPQKGGGGPFTGAAFPPAPGRAPRREGADRSPHDRPARPKRGASMAARRPTNPSSRRRPGIGGPRRGARGRTRDASSPRPTGPFCLPFAGLHVDLRTTQPASRTW
jgi:hypothetical protein